MRRRLTATAAALLLTGCFFHRSGLRDGEEVSPPQGLDSVATVRWVAARRAECAGRLVMLLDEGAVRTFDGEPAQYHSGLIAVVCRRNGR
jgi:hypothetical protein